MNERTTFLVFGASGRTGRHLVDIAIERGHEVRALARTPSRLADRPGLTIQQGSVTELDSLDPLVEGVDAVVVMLGDATAQRERPISTELVRRLVPAMRRHGVRRLVYQAGALSAPPGRRLSPLLHMVRATVARAYDGQHRDNEAVMRFLVDEAPDVDWVVHRAGIGSDRPSRGRLHRSRRRTSIATFIDCADYTYRLLTDSTATHTHDTSHY